MACTNTAAVIAVEILVEQDQIPPMGIVLEQIDRTIEGPPAIGAASEQIDQAMFQQQ